MYASYFGLREPPFAITPDPRYLYLGERHREALAGLLYGSGEGGGFVQLTGEVGTGKTTLCRSLIDQTPPEVDVALVLNPSVTPVELVATVCDELKVPYPPGTPSVKVLVDALHRHLLDAHARGRRTVLVVDEAQSLTFEVLEQIRLLTNLETETTKLLQVILIGQPELIPLLDRPRLRQVAQRITARYHLMPLAESETGEYIRHRLRVAGNDQEIFLPAAVREVHKHSGGVPRLINIICDRALLGAYGSNSRVITGEMASKAAGESMKIESTRPRTGALIEFFSRSEVIFAPLAVILTGVLIYQVIMDRRAENAPVATPAAAAATPAPAAPVAATPTATNAAKPQPLQITQPLPVVMSRLIELWAPNFRLSSDTNICRALRSERVECFKEHGKWADLAALNRPAILTLQTSDGTAHHVLLRQLDSTYATLETAMGSLRYTRQELDSLWNGEFLVLWRPEIDATIIGPESRGDSVIWLRKRLAELNGKPAPSPLFGFFDKGLRDEVMQFQVKRGLEKSGVVRTRTLIALGDNQPDTPTLSGSLP